MKKTLNVLISIIAIALLASCTPNKGVKDTRVKNAEIKDIEAYCASFVDSCPQNEKRCESCGTSVAASYISCHSREFCNNIPME